MTSSLFCEEQVVAILRKSGTGIAMAEVRRKCSVSSATFYKWKAKFGGIDVSDAAQLRALEADNIKPKKLLVEAILDNAVRKDLAPNMVTPVARRAVAGHMQQEHRIRKRRES